MTITGQWLWRETREETLPAVPANRAPAAGAEDKEVEILAPFAESDGRILLDDVKRALAPPRGPTLAPPRSPLTRPDR